MQVKLFILAMMWSSSVLAYNTSIYYKHTNMNTSTDDTRVRVKINDNFGSNERIKLKDAFQIVADEVGRHFRTERTGNRHSNFRTCTLKYSTKDFKPSSFRNSTVNNSQIFSSLMTGMVIVFRSHIETSKRAQIGYFNEAPQNGLYTMGRAPIYNSEWAKFKGMEITMNQTAVKDMDVYSVAGTIFHEIMHNLGWNHPTGYPGSFIKEAGLCISRRHADRPVGFGLHGQNDPGYNVLD